MFWLSSFIQCPARNGYCTAAHETQPKCFDTIVNVLITPFYKHEKNAEVVGRGALHATYWIILSTYTTTG